MNHARPEASYDSASFYRPLEPLKRDGQMSDLLMQHPDDPTKLVRFGREGQYYDQAEMNLRVAQTQQVLDGLARHGVHHVHPHYIDETAQPDTARLTIIVDKIEQPESGELTSSPEALAAADRVLTQLCGYVTELANQGGYIDPEMMHLEQFVYDGQAMVLVDVEPLGANLVVTERDSLDDDGVPTDLLFTTARLVVDTVSLMDRTDTTSSRSAVAAAIEALPGDSLQTDEAKMLLLSAIDTGKISSEVQQLSFGATMHGEEW